MARRRQVYEGRDKALFEGPEPGTLVQHFKDDAYEKRSQKSGTIAGKGVLNKRISGVIRNIAAGGLVERFSLAESTALTRSIIEFYYKANEAQRPLVTEEYITAFGWAHAQKIDEILALSLRINDFLTGLFLGIGLRLVNVNIEFGRLWDNENLRIMLTDEISPDSCRLWDVKTNEPMDKDRFKRDLGRVAEAFQEIARRLSILPRVND